MFGLGILEIMMVAAGPWIMYRVAELEERSGLFWALITVGLTPLSLWLIPLGYVRVLAPVIVAFLAMFVVKLVTEYRRDM